MINLMGTIGDATKKLYDWAFEETDFVKAFCKGFIAGAVDGWEFGCMIIGNIVCIAGVIMAIKKPKIEEDYED